MPTSAAPRRLLSMWATRPAAWATLPCLEIGADSLDSALPRLGFLGVFYPTDPLIACDGRNIFPERQCRAVIDEALPEVLGNVMYDTGGDGGSGHEVSCLHGGSQVNNSQPP